MGTLTGATRTRRKVGARIERPCPSASPCKRCRVGAQHGLLRVQPAEVRGGVNSSIQSNTPSTRIVTTGVILQGRTLSADATSGALVQDTNTTSSSSPVSGIGGSAWAAATAAAAIADVATPVVPVATVAVMIVVLATATAVMIAAATA